MITNLFWLPNCGFPEPEGSDEPEPTRWEELARVIGTSSSGIEPPFSPHYTREDRAFGPPPAAAWERLREAATSVSEATRGLVAAMSREDIVTALAEISEQDFPSAFARGMALHDQVEMRIPVFRPSGVDTGRTTANRGPEPITRYDGFMPRIDRQALGRSLFPVQSLPLLDTPYFFDEEE